MFRTLQPESELKAGIHCAILGCPLQKMTTVNETWQYLNTSHLNVALRERFKDGRYHGLATKDSLG